MKEFPYPWTDSGLELLDNINQVIKENGGREAMYDAVCIELNRSIHWHYHRKEQEVFRLTLRYSIPYKQACALIPMCYRQFLQRINEYKNLNHENS